MEGEEMPLSSVPSLGKHWPAGQKTRLLMRHPRRWVTSSCLQSGSGRLNSVGQNMLTFY